ncbi:MAG: TraR/DksA C4-type zinc finger protein [Candidatus Paceibacterota bacterium]|jgi:RNA polymerase-binding transcription factor DksA
MTTKHFKEKLEEDKLKLEEEMASVGRKNLAVPGDWEPAPIDVGMESNPIDQADVITNRENDVAVLADLEARYDAILTALSRIDKNTYGKCEVCGEEIQETRLEADPSATTCTKHL